MKYFIAAIVLLTSTFSLAGELDGKEFCRTVPTGGAFGQPAGTGRHCVSFKQDVMTDNKNTFFGNPPESIHYVFVSNKVLVVRNGNLFSDYVVDESMKTLSNSVGAILELK